MSAPPVSQRPRRTGRWASAAGHLLAWGVTLGAPAVLCAVIWRFGVDIPRLDEWDVSNILALAGRGELEPAALIRQHNEHRLAVARVVMLAFAWATDWNLRYQMVVSPLLAGLTLGLLALVGARTVTDARPWYVAVALTSVLLFSLVQHENWLWAIEHIYFVPAACLAGALALSTSRWSSKTRWTLSATLCVISSFSLANGLLVWFLVLPPLWWPIREAPDRGRLVGLAIWAVAFTATLAIFLYGYEPVRHHPALANPLTNPVVFWRYVAIFLGAPFARGVGATPEASAAWCGALVVSLFVVAGTRGLLNRATWRTTLPWAMVGSFPVLSGIGAGFARAGMGEHQALESRYTTFTVALAVGTCWLLAQIWDRHLQRGTKPRVLGLAATLLPGAGLLVMLSLSSLAAVGEIVSTHRVLKMARAALPFLGEIPDVRPYGALYPAIDRLERRARPLWRHELIRPPRRRGFRLPNETDVVVRDGSAGRIEQVTRGDASLLLTGRAVIPERGAAADLVVVAAHERGRASGLPFVFGTMEATSAGGLVAALGQPLTSSRWTADVPLAAIPENAVRLTVWGIDADSGQAWRLRGQYRLVGDAGLAADAPPRTAPQAGASPAKP